MLINSPNISGSLTVTGNSVITGSLTVLGGITGAITGSATTASYVEYSNVANKPTLVSGSAQVSFNGITDKPTLVSGSAQVSFNGITDKPTLVSGSSQITYSGLSGIPSGIVSSSAQVGEYGIFATTGSNTFVGNQTITGSIFGTGSLTINGCITATGQIVAQTINVQQVTSSIVYSCGSNIFGTNISNTQQFTGSIQASGSSHYMFGNLGLGTDTPSGKLSISAVGADGVVLSPDLSDTNNSARIFFIRTGGEGWALMNNAGNLSIRSGAIPGTTSGAQKLSITTDGVAIYSCQVCTPHLVASNNISIGSSCTSTSGYNTRLRITNIANDTFVFAFNNLSCKPIMQMYGGNTNNPQGYTTWLDNTTDNLNHLISHNTAEATYFASQGGNVGIGTSSLVTTCTNGALTIVKRHNLDTPPSVTAQCYYCNQSGLYIFGRNSGISLISSTNEESRIQFASPSSEWFAAIGATTLDSPVGGTLYFRTGASNTNRFSIDNTGISYFSCQVCVTTLVAANCINIGTSTSLGSRLSIESPNDQAGVTMFNTFDCNKWSLRTGTAGINNKGFGIVDDICNATRIQIDSAGNVGIGTQTPSGLGRAFVVSTNGYPDIIVERTGTNARKWGMTVGSDGSYLLRDYTCGNNRITIDTNGEISFACRVSAPQGVFTGGGITSTGTINLSNCELYPAVRIGVLNSQYPYNRMDSVRSDGSGYFWGFGTQEGSTNRVKAFFVDNVRGWYSADQLSVVSWVANEFNGGYPSYTTAIRLHASTTSYIVNNSQFLIGRTSFCDSFSFANTETCNGQTWLGPLSLGNSGGGVSAAPLYCNNGGKRWAIGWNSGDMNSITNYNNCTPFLLAWGINGDNPPVDRKFCFNYDGNAYASGGTWGTLSSNCIIKTCITAANSQWNDIKNICIVNYKMKDEIEEYGNAARIHLGVVAEQVAEVSPGLLEQGGYSEKWCTCLNGVKTSILYMKTVKALQEAMCRIEILESCLNVQ